MPHVFISYSRKDSDFAHELIEELRASKILHWIDSHELMAGDNWDVKIDDAIRNSFAVLLIMSPSAKSSENVIYEWAFAFGANITVIPAYYEEIDVWHSKIHPTKIQYIDFRDKKRPFGELIATLTRLQTLTENDIEPSDYLKKKYQVAMDGDTQNIRVSAIHDIEKSSHPAVIDTLLELIEKGHLPDTIINAGIVIARKTNATDVRALPALFSGIRKDNHYRTQVINLVRQYGELAINGLIELLDAKWSEARFISVLLLGELKAVQTIDKLIVMVNNDSDRKVQLQAINSLILMDAKTALPAIRDNFKKVPSDIGLTAFAFFRDTEDYPLIISSLNKYGSDIVLDTARKAVRKVGSDIAPYLREAIISEESNEAIRANAIGLLGDVDDGHSIPFLLEMLNHPNWERRVNIIQTLGKTGDESVIDILAKLLDNEEDAIAEASIRALGSEKFENRKVIQILILALNHKNPDVQEYAIYTLGRLKTEEALPKLIELAAIVKDKEDGYTIHMTIQRALTNFSKEQIDNVMNAGKEEI